MRLFRKKQEDMTRDSDPELVQALRVLGDRWNPAAVALNAAYLSDPKLVRDLIDVGSRHISFQPSDPWRSSGEGSAGDVVVEASAPTDSIDVKDIIRIAHAMAELTGTINAIDGVAKDPKLQLPINSYYHNVVEANGALQKARAAFDQIRSIVQSSRDNRELAERFEHQAETRRAAVDEVADTLDES